MAQPNAAPYGSWKSPITSDLIVAETISLDNVQLDGDDIYWLEGRPSEGGRYVVVRRTPDGKKKDVTPAPFNVRTRVHEYGGGAYAVSGGVVYFSNFDDQRIYRVKAGETPAAITPKGKMRYADYVIDRKRSSLICVCEDHTTSEREAVNTIVRVSTGGNNTGTVLASGNDFYSSPALSPDGSKLAWLTWNHPNMPWDGTELWVADLNEDGSVKSSKCVAGGEAESIFQPAWSPDGALHFVSDRSGWWNLYRLKNGEAEPLAPTEAEFARPQWILGARTYTFTPNGRLLCIFTQRGTWKLARFDSGELKPLDIPFTSFGWGGVRASESKLVCVAGSATQGDAVIQLDLQSGDFETLHRSGNVDVDAGYLSVPDAIEFPTENQKSAHAFYYPPKNKDFAPPKEDKPPLLVISHGGPTSATSSVLRLTTQYWTSRGIAVLDVNYGGSTGYGRAYRERLNDAWGIVDLDDCANGAKYLVGRGEVDGNRLAIRGGSAGGYTTLAVLTFRDTFHAGASHYGVSDLGALAKETHKFESRYLDRLIGPYPERKDIYEERSPIHHTERLSSPLILFQGLEDKVVPPNQAEMMADALRAKGVPVAHVTFEGEQHGFRKAENIKRALDGELYFYSRIFGFKLAEAVERVEIDNLAKDARIRQHTH